MKIKFIVFLLIAILSSCASSRQYLLFKSDSEQAVIKKQYIVAAELGEDVTGNTRVIVTVDNVGLELINKFLSSNINRDMDILFGEKVISSAMRIRTDHFLKDIIIPFQDKKLAKEFYEAYPGTLALTMALNSRVGCIPCTAMLAMGGLSGHPSN